MSKRLEPSWVVLESLENPQHDRCVDLFSRGDGSVGFEEFRRDVEDAGAWTPVGYFVDGVYATAADARAAALASVGWLADALPKP